MRVRGPSARGTTAGATPCRCTATRDHTVCHCLVAHPGLESCVEPNLRMSG